MRIGDLLPGDRIVIPLPAKTLHDAAEQLIGSFVETGLASGSERLLAQLANTPAREAVVVGGNVFILHFRSDAVTGVGAALGVTAEPIGLDVDSDKTARVVVVVVAAYKEASVFLQLIAVLSRILNNADLVEAVVKACGPSEVEALDDLMQAELPGYLRVADVMNPRPRSIWPDAPLEDAARVMMANRMSSIPVTSEKGAVLGVVTHRDILRVALPSYLKRMSSGQFDDAAKKALVDADPRRVPVREVMDRSVLCVSEEQTLADVANLIIGKAADRFPVVRDGVLVGMLTRGDIVRRLYGP